MRKLIRDKQLVDDTWVYLGADDAIPAGTDIVVPLARFLANADALFAHEGEIGVRIEPGEGVTDLVPHLGLLPLICLNFPAFHDGRCLSYARELRERHRYAGEIRAVGDVARDQALDMYRCGINAFDVKEGKSIPDTLVGLGDFSTSYQGTVYDPRPVYRR